VFDRKRRFTAFRRFQLVPMYAKYPPPIRLAGRRLFSRALPAVLALVSRKMKHPPATKLRTALYALGAGSLLAVVANAQPNLLVAGDFEGITNPLDGYGRQVSPGVWGSESGSVTGAANGITPFGSQMLQINHSGGGTSAQTNQIVKGPFKAGSVVTFSVRFNSWLTASSIAPFPLQAAVSVGNAVMDSDPNTDNRSGPAVSSALVFLDTDTSTWQTATVTTTLTSDTDYLAAELYIKMNSGAGLGTPLAYADDAVLTVVPPTPGVNWVNWTGNVSEGGVTKYVGQMVVPRTGGGSTTVNVKYTSPGAIAFFQTSNNTDFFAQGPSGSLGRNPARSPYTSAKVPNIPDGGGAVSDKSDIIALDTAGTNRLEFTDASTGLPISIASPVFAYVSLNGNGYGFDQDFDILSFGDGTVRDQGYFGPGTSYKSVATVNGATQYQLLGTGEPHGTLQFRGAFSTVTWQSLSNEYWNGFTVGVTSLAADVPIANAGLDQTVTATSASGAAVQLSGSVSGSTHSPFTFTWTGPFGSVSGQNPTVNLAIGGPYTITLTVTDATGASDTDTVLVTVVTPPAPVITSATSALGVYGSPFSYTITATNSPTSFGAVGTLPAGLTLSGAVISGTPASTGTFNVQVSATNLGGTGTKTLGIAIAKANATVTVNGYTGTYDGGAHGATGSATGVNRDDLSAGLSLGASFTDVPGGTANWSFHDAAGNYNDASGSVAIVITKADATVTVNGYTGTYDGAAHGATGSATGVNRDDLSRGLNFGASFTDAPGGTANWTFTGGTNYNDARGSVAIAISKADATVTVNGYTGVYDGAAHGATGSATGVNRDDLSAGLNLGASFTDAPGGTANWTFAGGTNYNDASGTAAITIDKAPSTTTTVGAGPFTYDGTTHSGGSGTVAGAGTVTGSATVTYSGDQVNAGSYTVTAHYAGDTNHTASDGAAVTITINKASSTTTTVGAGPFTYDGTTHAGGSGTVAGAGTVTGSATVTYFGDQVNAGSYTVTAHYAGDANHTASDGAPVTVVINKANATVVVTPYNVLYDGLAHTATVTSITGVHGETGAAVGAVTLHSTHTYSGTYASDSWSFTGANYNNLAGTITDTITPVIASVAPSTGTLWPPNHQMVAITLHVGTNGDNGVSGYLVTATSSEPDNGLGDGDTPNDIQITGSGTLNPVINLRAERSGNGSGRTYTITVRAIDAAGNLSAPKSTTVFVPKSQGGK
jgi:hypothetical protein